MRRILSKALVMKIALVGLATVLLLSRSYLVAAESSPSKPNIILMVADDLGYHDLGCYGATRIATPRIDALAAQGTRFTDAHSYAGICVPSRYSLLSGRYAFRSRLPFRFASHFEDGQVLLPAMLKTAGYRTAMVGKWHNGWGRDAMVNWNTELTLGPVDHGFDSFFGIPCTHSEPPFVFVKDRRIVGLEKEDPIRLDLSPGTGPHGKQLGGAKAMNLRPVEQIDLRLAREARDFLASVEKHKPFFLYLAWAAPHNPLSPSASFKGTSKAGAYGDFIQQLDHCVGLVLDSLEKYGHAQNTLVIFTSDNAGRYESNALRAGHRTNGNLLGQKTDVWEGGHRVPFIIRWPGRIAPATQRHELLSHLDLMATLAQAAGAPMPAGASPDGHSELATLLDAKSSPVRTELIYQGTASLALRSANWVYIPKPGSGGKTVPEPDKPFGPAYTRLGFTNSDVNDQGQLKPDSPGEQLYNLDADVGQQTNLAASQPERLKAMRERFHNLTAGFKSNGHSGN